MAAGGQAPVRRCGGGDDPAVARLREAVRRVSECCRGRPRTGLSHQDADDVVGTVASDDAVGFDPLPLLCALHDFGARAVVIGQVAGIMHGSRELTGDLDLLWDGSVESAPAMAAAFAAVSATLTDDDGVALPCAVESFVGRAKVLFRSTGACGDCCTPALPWGEVPVARMVRRCVVATTAGGHRIFYLDRGDLVGMRVAAGRVKDLRRVAELRRLPAAVPVCPTS